MFSSRQTQVRESPPPPERERDLNRNVDPDSRYSASTMTEDSTLFMIHQLRKKAGILPQKRRWWERLFRRNPERG